MDPAKAALQTIDRIYAAAMAPDQWTPALEGVVDLLGGGHATLNVHGTEPAGAAFIASARLDERDLAAMLSPDTLRQIVPLVGALPLGIASRAVVISDPDFERSAVYNEVFRPLNGFHSLHFRRNGTGGAFLLSVCRPQRVDDFDATDTDALRAIASHLKTALMLQSRLQAAEHGRAGLARVLDRLAAGVIVTDAAARAAFVNTQASRIVHERDGLTLDADRLAAMTPAATQELHDAIAAVAADEATEGRRLRLERPSYRPPLMLTLLPISRLGTALPGGGPAARVAIFIKDLGAPLAIDRLAVAEAFRLTPRECDVAVLLADGHDLGRIAALLGVGLSTVRYHLKRAFEKTGMRGQAALAALIRGFADPH
jgi:DNA-binding CsgD family transcriptional regulator